MIQTVLRQLSSIAATVLLASSGVGHVETCKQKLQSALGLTVPLSLQVAANEVIE